MTTHRDYSDIDLARALISARNRRDGYRYGSDGHYTAAAIVATLEEEQRRRLRVARSAARSALGMAPASGGTAPADRCEHGWTGPWNARPCGCGKPAPAAPAWDYSKSTWANRANGAH